MRPGYVIATALLSLAVTPWGSYAAVAHTTGPVEPSAVAARTSAPTAKLTAPREVTEGDRFTIRIGLTRPTKVRRVHIQHRVTDIFRDSSWQTVKKLRVQDRKKLTYRAVAGQTDRDRYRVVLQPKAGRSIASKAVSVKVWHWYPLSTFDSYYSTAGVMDYSFTQFAMNGRTYVGSWYSNGTYSSWESRYTLGRHCRTVRGVFGVTDSSADGSTATVQILSEGEEAAYTSPTLVPGAVATKVIALASPYRISILGTNTSAGGLLAYPAAGDLQFLCSGLE